MPEAEVSLRLAFALIERGLVPSGGAIEVAIDGAQVKTCATTHFAPEEFMRTIYGCGWSKNHSGDRWQGTYSHPQFDQTIKIHSTSGCADVVAHLTSGQRLRVESKKGPVVGSRNAAEYSLLREALGQVLTMADVSEGDVLAVAVPHSEKFEKLAERWREAPLVQKIGVLIFTISEKQVFGLPTRP